MRSERVPGLAAEGTLVGSGDHQAVLPGDRDEAPAATLAAILAGFAQTELVVEESVRRLIQSQLEDEGMLSLDPFLAQETQAHARSQRDGFVVVRGRVETHPQNFVDPVGPTVVVLAETGRMTQLVRQSIDDRDSFPHVQVDFDRRRRLSDTERLFQEGPLSLSPSSLTIEKTRYSVYLSRQECYAHKSMAYWLLKSDPETYSWDDLVKEKETEWTGVRNFQARNNLRLMKTGDMAFIYHSQDDKEIVGIAEILSEAHPDKTAEEGDWSSVKIKAIKPCTRHIGLEEVRNTPVLNVMPLVTNSRLSVQPVTEAQWKAILKYTKTEL